MILINIKILLQVNNGFVKENFLFLYCLEIRLIFMYILIVMHRGDWRSWFSDFYLQLYITDDVTGRVNKWGFSVLKQTHWLWISGLNYRNRQLLLVWKCLEYCPFSRGSLVLFGLRGHL